MHKINDDMQVLGTLSATELCGKLHISEALTAELQDLIADSPAVVALASDLAAAQSALAELKKENVRIAETYNKAIEVINDLAQRVAALEANYDPTIIK